MADVDSGNEGDTNPHPFDAKPSRSCGAFAALWHLCQHLSGHPTERAVGNGGPNAVPGNQTAVLQIEEDHDSDTERSILEHGWPE